MKPASFRFSECCRRCQHFSYRTMQCDRFYYKIDIWNITTKVCDYFCADDENEVDE